VLPIVALVGRPNVGKSTLFNALTRSRDALVHDRPGVTRDRHYGICRDGGRSLVVVDTGGLFGDGDELAELSAGQARAAIEEADLVLFVLDARAGLLPADASILDALRRGGKRVVAVVNKTDGLDAGATLAEFARLGLADTISIAAAHRQGIDALIALVHRLLPESVPVAEPEVDPDRVRVAIIGRPNVGKSTLVNRLLGEERVLASEIPGTTRDAIRVALERDGRKYLLIDTAGVRRRARVEDAVEKFSVLKTLQALDDAHVAIVLLDASEGVTEQDVTVLGHALDSGRALVVAVNKWDHLDRYQRERCRSELDRRLDFVPHATRVFISARHGSGLRELMRAVDRVHRAAGRELGAGELTRALEAAVEALQPPLVRGRVAKLRYAHLGGRHPPRVVIHGSRLASLPQSYHRYLENFLRKRFKLEGTPVRLEFREGANPFEGRRNEPTERQVRKRRRVIRHARKGR
jgi:GTP-binding protein